MAQDGYLVAPEWAKRVDETVRRVDAAQLATRQDVGSVFYDLRPAVLASAWSQNGAGLWAATANFVVNDAVDSSFTFPVAAPTATDDPGGDVGITRFFVVWRGRWELVAGAGGITADEIKDLLDTEPATQRVIEDFSLSLVAGGYLALNLDVTNIKYYKAP